MDFPLRRIPGPEGSKAPRVGRREPEITTEDGGQTFTLMVNRHQAIALTVLAAKSPLTYRLSRTLGRMLFPPVGTEETAS
jgi:hypothetical protein